MPSPTPPALAVVSTSSLVARAGICITSKHLVKFLDEGLLHLGPSNVLRVVGTQVGHQQLILAAELTLMRVGAGAGIDSIIVASLVSSDIPSATHHGHTWEEIQTGAGRPAMCVLTWAATVL